MAIRPVGMKEIDVEYIMHSQIRWQFKPMSNSTKALIHLEGVIK